MLYSLQKDLNKPLYQQIIEVIETAAFTGKLQPGERLPSERDLSQFFNVNRSTVVRAMEELHERNIIIRKIGAGTFINPQKWGLFTEPRMQWNQITEKKAFEAPVTFDLTNGDLPLELYPNLQLPEIDWQLLLEAEQENSASRLGTQRLRQTVQSYLLDRHQWQVDLHEVLITSGTQQAISLIALGLLKTGDAVAIENPSYFYSLSIFQALGIRIYGIPMDRDGIMIEKLDELVHKHSLKMIFINPIFHNPTGKVISPQRKKALLDYCERKRILIIEDDAYAQIKFEDHLNISPIKMQDQHDNVIYLSSLSKYLGRSIRIGWMIAPPAITEHLANIRQQLDSGLSSLPQFMAEFYLQHYSKDHELKLQQDLAKRSKSLEHWVDDNLSDLLTYQAPTGGFHLYAELLKPNSSKLVEERLQTLSAKATKNSFFGGDDTAFRLSFAHFPIPKEP
ncbi:aminotransferase-like domain-containing protein [Ignatzschineria sp. LJL83]